MYTNKQLPIVPLLYSGHKFTEQEHMLGTHYVLSNIILMVLSLTLGMLAYVRYLENHQFYTIINIIASLISILVIYVLRKVPTRFFYNLAHVVFSVFLILILFSFHHNVITFPASTWFLIYIMGLYFIFDHVIARRYIFIFIVLFLYVAFNDKELNTHIFVGDFALTAVLGYVFIYCYDYREKELRKKLLSINKDLEDRITTETKARTKTLSQEKETSDFLAKHDYLTKIPNMLSLHEALDKKCLNVDNSFALVYLDLDKFKNINDIYGHQIGNKILVTIANRLQKTLPESMITRVSGDEFILLVDDYTTEINLEKDIERCILAIEKDILIGNTSVVLYVSIGISIFPDDHIDKEYLIKFADRAVRKSKKSPISQYTFYSHGSSIFGYSKIQLELDLHTALLNHEFILYYQPQIDTKTEKIVGIEALLRWNHPSLGILTPVYFLDLAKELGILGDIEKHVLKVAFASVAHWHKNCAYQGRVSINLSIQKLESKLFLTELYEALRLHNCRGEWVEFEILETEIFSDINKVQTILKELHQKNIHIAIDDFGAGYASLSYLLLLEIDKIKIDKIFIDRLLDSPRTVAIMDAIVAIATNSNYKIVAEGVETQKQLDLLVERQCSVIQGYYYYKPLPKDTLDILLQKNSIKYIQ